MFTLSHKLKNWQGISVKLSWLKLNSSMAPRILLNPVATLSGLILVLVTANLLDPGIIVRPPVNLTKLSSQNAVSFEKVSKQVLYFKRHQKRPKCPGPACPLDASGQKIYKWTTHTKPYLFLDDLANPTLIGGLMYQKMEFPTPGFLKSGEIVAFDILGVNGSSWRLFLNGIEVKSGKDGLLSEAILFRVPNSKIGGTVSLGLEVDVGKTIAPGIRPGTQAFLSKVDLAPTLRSTYREADISTLLPVIYMLAGIAILTAIGAFFTPFYAELLFFSGALMAWLYRHAYANMLTDIPKWMTHDFVTLDACLKTILYGCLVCFFCLYFRFKTHLVKYILIGGASVLVLLQIGWWANRHGLSYSIFKFNSLPLGLTMAFGSFAAYQSVKSIYQSKRISFRLFVCSFFAIFLAFASAAYLLRFSALRFGFPNREFMSQYLVGQVYASWIYVIASVFGGTIALEWALVVKDRQKILKRFGMVVDKRVLEELTTKEKLSSTRIDHAVVMFIDLRGFTQMCETLSPDQLVDTLNEFLAIVSANIQRNGGMIDKFIGDAILALWGVPKISPYDCQNALAATQDIRSSIQKMNEKRHAQKLEPIRFGIGLHSGPVVFGAIGGHEHIDFTAIGPAVNIASRIQDLTKKYSSDVLLSDELVLRMGFNKKFYEVGTEMIRGTDRKMRLFELKTLDESSQVTSKGSNAQNSLRTNSEVGS